MIGVMDDEGVLDPWVAEWMAANPERSTPFADLSPEILELARGPVGFPPTREIAHITDELVGDVPIRIYQGEGEPTGVVVYFHGGGFVIGSIGLMDNVARELAHGAGAVVVSVGYRLAPEHPFPAGLDDCEAVTRWAIAGAGRFEVPPSAVVVAGESAGGNMAAAVSLRMRDAGECSRQVRFCSTPVSPGESCIRRLWSSTGSSSAERRARCTGRRTAARTISTATRTPRRFRPHPWPGFREPLSFWPAATCCATKGGRTPSGCATMASMSTRSAMRANPTALSTSTFLPPPCARAHRHLAPGTFALARAEPMPG